MAGLVEAAVFTVSNANDSGAGSLRQAMLDANATPGPDEIRFDATNYFVPWITPDSPLPVITDPVTIDGTTAQYWFYAPLVTLDGQWSVGGNGITIQSSHCAIKGLNIQRFNGAGVWIEGGESNVVQRCWFGVDTRRWAYNAWGVVINRGRNNLIGGTTTFARNWISGNRGANVWLREPGSSGNRIQGNIIGPDLSGGQPAPNQSHGVIVDAGATNNLIGGTETGAGNVVSGLPGVGLYVSGAHTVIQGNWIGLDYYGLRPLGNGSGCNIVGQASGSSVGGADPAARNVIVHNATWGVGIADCTNVAVMGNAIHSNGGLGIDLAGNGISRNDRTDADTGANQLQNYPVLHAASGEGFVSGVLTSAPNARFRLEFFCNTACDPGGFGEGESFAGAATVQTGADGVATFSQQVVFVPGQFVASATASDEAGNTSEFSPCLPIANAPPRFVKGPDQQVDEDSGVQIVYGWATDINAGGPGEVFQTISFVVTNDRPSLFTEPPSLNELGTLRFQPTPGAAGMATVTVILTDDGGTANGGRDQSEPQAFFITVRPVNHPPVAIAQVVAPGIFASNEFEVTVVSTIESNVTIVLDAGHSFDVDGDRLDYEWRAQGVAPPFSPGVRSTNVLGVGSLVISLLVSDRLASDADDFTLNVITPVEAITQLIQQVNDTTLPRALKLILNAALYRAAEQLNRGQVCAGLISLRIFERIVLKRVTRIDPITGQALLISVQAIIGALEASEVCKVPSKSDAPALLCVRSNGIVSICWPRSAREFVLEETLALLGVTPSWKPVIGRLQTNAMHYYLTMPEAGEARFYRLRKP